MDVSRKEKANDIVLKIPITLFLKFPRFRRDRGLNFKTLNDEKQIDKAD